MIYIIYGECEKVGKKVKKGEKRVFLGVPGDYPCFGLFFGVFGFWAVFGDIYLAEKGLKGVKKGSFFMFLRGGVLGSFSSFFEVFVVWRSRSVERNKKRVEKRSSGASLAC